MIFQSALQLSMAHTPSIGCRSLDILHIAIAADIQAAEFITTDGRQSRLAQAMGLTWSPIGCVGWQPPEPEARQKVAGGATTGFQDIAAHDHRAPKGAREAFDGCVAFVPFSRPSRAQRSMDGVSACFRWFRFATS
jgi:hypothetical protein